MRKDQQERRDLSIDLGTVKNGMEVRRMRGDIDTFHTDFKSVFAITTRWRRTGYLFLGKYWNGEIKRGGEEGEGEYPVIYPLEEVEEFSLLIPPVNALFIYLLAVQLIEGGFLLPLCFSLCFPVEESITLSTLCWPSFRSSPFNHWFLLIFSPPEAQSRSLS